MEAATNNPLFNEEQIMCHRGRDLEEAYKAWNTGIHKVRRSGGPLEEAKEELASFI